MADDRFIEEECSIGTAPWQLPGTLTLPRGAGPFPVIVLVHGSGPNDRDETIGPNKPFRDLACGLAASGVAVLRYDKRTQVYPGAMAALSGPTVFDETIADVQCAVAHLRSDPRINAGAVFGLGHSLGGYLMPRILHMCPELAGAVLWAASFRPLAIIIQEQIAYVSGLSETPPEAKEVLSAMDSEAQRILEMTRDLDQSGTWQALGVPASYWRDLVSYDPGSTLAQMTRPLLVLWGDADYQVTAEDFGLWKKAAENLPQAQFKQYAHLNHCFVYTDGPIATPSSYAIPGHVADAVIRDIAEWVLTGVVHPTE